MVLRQNNFASYFTARELDLLACLLSGQSSKKIAALLSITPKTVDAHIHNIMQKLDFHSREQIVEFIEKSPYFDSLKQHNTNLSLRYEFKQSLKNVSKQNRNLVSVFIKNSDHRLFNNVKNDLGYAGIYIFNKYEDDIDHVLYLIDQDSAKLVGDIKDIPKVFICGLKEDLSMSFLDSVDKDTLILGDNYYHLIFLILKCILPSVKMNQYVQYFKKQTSVLSEISYVIETLSTDLAKKKSLRNERLVIISIGVIVLLALILFLFRYLI